MTATIVLALRRTGGPGLPNRLSTRLRFRVLLGITFALAAINAPFSASAEEPDSYLAYDGEARSGDGTTVVYREHHVLRSHDGTLAERVVIYACPDGTAFARKRLAYAPSPLAPDVRFEDARSGSFQFLDSVKGERHLRSRDSAAAKPIDMVVPAKAGLVADAGFDEFIRRSWSKLISATPVGFDILLLSDGSVLHLKAIHAKHEQLAGEDVDVFRVSLSGLLGLIAPNIDVTYSSSDHALRRFEGISNIRNANGHQSKTIIDFPALAHRRVGGQAWQEAINSPLHARCET